MAGYALLIAMLAGWAPWLPLQIAIFMFCVPSLFSVLGGALYERRHELGLEGWTSPERTQEHVERLLTLKRNGEAFDVVAARLNNDPTFRPKTAAAALQIARIAAAVGGTARVTRTLLADFPTRFAGDPSVTAANTLAQHLSA